MTTTEKSGFTCEARLAGVAPKAGNPSSYEESKKDNTLVLTLELKLPAPTPPRTFDRWANDWQLGGNVKGQAERELGAYAEKVKKEAVKLPPAGRGKHWFEPVNDPAGEPVCKRCGKAEPDGDKCLVPAAAATEDVAILINRKRDELSVQLRDRYDQYVREQTSKMNKAFAATLSSGLFVAMLGQNVEITFQPSSDLFQPMLDGTFAIQERMMERLQLPESGPVTISEAEDIAGLGRSELPRGLVIPGEEDGEGEDEEGDD